MIDDLSGALDAETERRFWDGLAEAGSSGLRPTLIVVSHRHHLLRRADRVLVLENGRVKS